MTAALPVQIPDDLLQRCFAHGAETYPDEACGVLSGPTEGDAVDEAHALENKLNALHAADPERYPRTAHEGYVMDPQELFKLEKALKQAGRRIKVYYHTHPDVGAYFSEEDRKRAMWGDVPLLPDALYLVCGVKNREPDGAILAVWNEGAQAFDTLPVQQPVKG